MEEMIKDKDVMRKSRGKIERSISNIVRDNIECFLGLESTKSLYYLYTKPQTL